MLERTNAIESLEPRALRVLFFLDYDDSQGGQFSNSPGLLPLIGHTRACGFDLDFVSSEGSLLNKLRSEVVDVVAISSMERLLARSIAVAKRIRKQRPGIILMIGGNAIDPFALDLASSLFDIVVLGEAEHIFPSVLDAIALARGCKSRVTGHVDAPILAGRNTRAKVTGMRGGLDAHAVDLILQASFERCLEPDRPVRIRIGNTYVRDGERNAVWYLDEPEPKKLQQAGLSAVGESLCALAKSSLGSAPLAEELDALCQVPWDIVRDHGWRHFEFYAQRGCRWGRCRFCSVSDREVRAQSTEKVMEIIREASRNGVEMVSFADDLFVQHKSWNIDLLQQIIDERLPGVEFRAQTMATASVWPLLRLMKAAGFSELAFGVETLNPRRAEFMTKSFNGRKYIQNAIETTHRVAAAGINPVLYMIMVDPCSTLEQIAEEIYETVKLCSEVFAATGVLPKISYSLMMLPVACTSITDHFPYNSKTIDLGDREISLPSEFLIDQAVAAFLSSIARLTNNMPHRRENLSAFESYFSALEDVSRRYNVSTRAEIEEFSKQGQSVLSQLVMKLDDKVDSVTKSVERLLNGYQDPDFDPQQLDFRWLGGYVNGIKELADAFHQGGGRA